MKKSFLFFVTLTLILAYAPAFAMLRVDNDLGLSDGHGLKLLNPLEKGLMMKDTFADKMNAGLLGGMIISKLLNGGGDFSSYFGLRFHPIYHRMQFHDGIDIKTVKGTPVKSPVGGTVLFSGWQGGYGKVVIVEHMLGWTTCYAHLSNMFVSAGDYLNAGDLIGSVGSTGVSNGPHLHFEVRFLETAMDPVNYFSKIL